MRAPDDLGLERFTGYLLRLAHEHAHQVGVEAFPDGPHPREYAVLTALSTLGALSQQRLAERMHVNRTSMVAVADELELRGLVERRRDASDRRSYALHMTPEGVEALQRLHGEIALVDRQMAGALTDAERLRMNELLRTLVVVEPDSLIPPPLADRSGFLLSRAHLLARDRANERLRPLGIVVRQFGLLSLLDRCGPSSQQALAGRLQVSATMVTQLVDQLEALGLAERRRNPDDRRSYLVTLTDAGERTVHEARTVIQGMQSEFEAALGAAGDRELQGLLRKLIAT